MDWYSIWMTSNCGIHSNSRCASEIELVYGIVAMTSLNGRVHLWHDPFLLGFCTLEPSCCKGPVGEEYKISILIRVLSLGPSCCKGTMRENTKYPFLLGFCILEPSCCKGHLGEEHKIFWTSVYLCLQAYLALRNCLVEELRDFSILIQAHYQFSFCRSKRNSVFQKGTLSSCKCYRCDFLKGKVGQTERFSSFDLILDTIINFPCVEAKGTLYFEKASPIEWSPKRKGVFCLDR